MAARLSDTPITLSGPSRKPAQMLSDQSYGGHTSVHDDESAAALGLPGAPIEGPTHFSQFEPLLLALWGERWPREGTLSAHFLNMVVEGESVQATVTLPGPGATDATISAVKADGTPVLEGSASVGPDHSRTALAPRLAKAQANPPDALHIIDQMHVGQRGASAEAVTIGFDDHLGALYPFTLRQKLERMTESIEWHQSGSHEGNPWGRPVMPFEMMSVVTQSTSGGSGFVTRQPSVGLFIDLEVRMLDGPVFVDHSYRVEREIVAMGQSRRTESYWTLTTLIDAGTDRPTAEVLLHQGVFKDSYPEYPAS